MILEHLVLVPRCLTLNPIFLAESKPSKCVLNEVLFVKIEYKKQSLPESTGKPTNILYFGNPQKLLSVQPVG